MTETLRVAGGVATDPLAVVETDGVTILGDGTSGNPLNVSVVTKLFQADSIGAQHPLPGNPVITSAVSPVDSLYAVSPATPGLALTGMVISVEPNSPNYLVSVLPYGVVGLTTEQWNAVTGGSGGLTRGAVYYQSETVAGGITTVRPTAPGTYTARVGIAVNPTTMVLTTPTKPTLNG